MFGDSNPCTCSKCYRRIRFILNRIEIMSTLTDYRLYL